MLVSLRFAGSLVQGVKLAVASALFGAIFPLVSVVWLVRQGKVSDRQVGVRQQRPGVLAVGLVSTVIGLGLVLWIGAPRQLLGVVGAGIAGVVVCLALSLVWKLSIHLAVASGAAVLLALALSPWLWTLLPLIVPVGWARVTLRVHTLAQVVAGGAIAAVVYPLLLALLPA